MALSLLAPAARADGPSRTAVPRRGVQEERQFLTGVKPPTKEEQAWLDKHATRITTPQELERWSRVRRRADLPARVVNVDYLPRVGRQYYGSCVSWAMVYYYKTWQEAKEHGWLRPDPAVNPERVMSPAFVFNLANAGDAISGTGESTNLEYLMTYGACPCSVMEANADPFEWPSEDQFLAAFPQRGQTSAQIMSSSDDGFAALKEHLASGDLATFSMTIFKNFSYYPTPAPGIDSASGVYYAINGGLHATSTSSGHELCIVGYDDNKTYVDGEGNTQTGALLVVNSCGTEWGVSVPEAGEAGFIWLSYDFFRSATSMAFIMTDRIGYQPTLVGSFHIQHGRRLEVGVDLLGGDRDNPDWSFGVFPRTGGDRPIDRTVAFDATDYASADNYSWWLRVNDYDLTQFQPTYSGYITSFKMKRQDGILWESPDVPVQTVETNKVNAYAWVNVASLYEKPGMFTSLTPGVASHAWGDLDADGDMDMIYYDAGTAYPDPHSIHCYRNDGQGNLTEVQSGLPVVGGQQELGDYDGDGWPDLALNGYDSDAAEYATRLMRNLGDGRFAPSGADLPVSEGRLDWIDYNGDGRLDLCVNEYDTDLGQYTGLKLMRNDGGGVFTKVDLGISKAPLHAWADYDRDGDLDLAAVTGVGAGLVIYRQDAGTLGYFNELTCDRFGSLAWGDVDNDGWLDLALTRSGESGQLHIGEVWRNQSGGSFTLWGSFPGAIGGSLAWGDVDNDGLVDLAVCGDFGGTFSSEVNVDARVLRNKGDGTFVNLGFNLLGVGFLTQGPFEYLRWFDYDGDGDLDLSLAGPGPRTESYPRRMRLYENRAAQSGGLNRPNTPPTVPTGLDEVQYGTGLVTLLWDDCQDAQTAAGGLFYNVRVGTNPGWGDLVTPDVSAPIWGQAMRPTLNAWQLGMMINPAPSKAFFWSVQAIDPSQGCSAWSAPRMFVPSGATLAGDANQDGAVDVADLVSTVRMVDGEAAPEAAADRNGDGRVDLVDMKHTRAILLGAEGLDQSVLAESSVGPEGGQLEAEGFAVQIAAGAFDAGYEIQIERNPQDLMLEGNSISGAYRIKGMPVELGEEVKVTVRPDSAPSGDVFMALGEMGLPASSGVERRSLRLLPAVAETDGTYSCVINLADVVTQDRRGAPVRRGSSKGYTLDIDCGLVDDIHVWANSRFSIEFPFGVDLAHIIELSNALENAHAKFKNSSTYGFSYAKRTSWPVHVTVYTMDKAGTYGEFVASKRGDNYGVLEFNTANIADYASMRTTAYHEFFHLVQNLYDPRYGFTKAVSGGETLWLAEAASTWSEELGTSATAFVPPFFVSNIESPLKGMIAGATGTKEQIQDHGYGMAGMIKYLQSKRGDECIRKIYESVLAGRNSAEAVRLNASTMGMDFEWWSDYMQELVRGGVYKLSQAQLATMIPSQQQLRIAEEGHLYRSAMYSKLLPDLSGALYLASPLYNGFNSSQMLSCKLSFDENITPRPRLFLLKTKDGVGTQLLGEAVQANGGYKFDVTGLQQMASEGGWKIMALLTNEHAVAPYTGNTAVQFQWAVTGQKNMTMPSKTISAETRGQAIPTLACAGTFDGAGWADWNTMDYGMFKGVFMTMPARPPQTIQFTYTASISDGALTMPPDAFGEYEVWTVSEIKYYKFEFYEDTIDSHPQTIVSTSGAFSFEVDEDDISAGGPVYAVYDLVRKRYNSSDSLISSSTDSNWEWPIVIVNVMP